MAYVKRLPSGSWRAQYRDRTGQRHGRSFPSKREADDWAAEQERDVRRGRHYDPRAGRITVGEFEARWWDARVVEATTRATDRGRLDRHVLPRWRDVAVEAVTPTAVQGWARQMQRGGLAAATVRSCVQLLASILDAARRDGIIPDNPARGVSLPTVPPGAEVYLTRDEADRVLDQMKPDEQAVTMTLLYTGMRWGEVAGLHLRRVDLLRRRIDVVETLVEVKGQRIIKPYPKGKRRRTVPVPRDLADVLAAYLARHPTGRDELVFPSLSRHTWARSHLQPAMRKADVHHARVHDLRHTYASWLVQDGVPIAEVSRLLGHASITTTMRYAHFAPDEFDGVLSVLDRVSNVRQEVRQ